MASVVINGDTSGSVTITAPAVAGSTTLTLPAATGTVMVSGNMPAFSVYLTSAQTVSASTNTKILYDSEEFDTNNNFASSRFTPTVAGYYQINAQLAFGTITATETNIKIYKNGSEYKRGMRVSSTSSTTWLSISSIVYCNGTTDYIEIYAFMNSTSSNSLEIISGITNWFNGSMVRSA